VSEPEETQKGAGKFTGEREEKKITSAQRRWPGAFRGGKLRTGKGRRAGGNESSSS